MVGSTADLHGRIQTVKDTFARDWIALIAAEAKTTDRGSWRHGARAGAVAATVMAIAVALPAGAGESPRHTPSRRALALWARVEEALDAADTTAVRQGFRELAAESRGVLAANEGWALWQEARCAAGDDLAAAVDGDGDSTVRPARSDELARFRRQAGVVHGNAARLRRGGYLSAAAPLFADASGLACAAGDTLAGILYLQAALQCAVRAGDLAASAGWLARADTLLAVLTAAAGDETAAAAAAGPANRAEINALERLLNASRYAHAALWNATGRYDAADSLYNAQATIAAARGWTRQHADALYGLGTTHSRRRRIEKAREYYRAAYAQAQRLADRYRQASTLAGLGYDYTQQRDLDAAESALHSAMDIAGECGYVFLRGYILSGLAAVAEARGDRAQAVDLFRTALAEHIALANEAGELGARQRLAYNLVVLGLYPEASDHYDRCLDILERVDSLVIRNWVLAGLALVHHKLGRLDAAAEYYRRSLAVNRHLGDRVSEAWSLQSLGILHTMRGDYRRALIRIESARALCDSIGDADGVGDAEVAIAHVHAALGDFERSREHFERALAAAEFLRYEELLRRAASGLVFVCRQADRPDEARRYGRQALAVARKWSDRNAVLEALTDLAELHVEAGERDSAQTILVECNRFLAEGYSLLLGARVALLEARCAATPESAAERAAVALARAEESGLAEREWMACVAVSEAKLALGDTVSAARYLDHALDVVESLRRDVGSDELRRHMLRPALEPYEKRIAIHAGAGTAGDSALRALAVSERSRARILASRLRSARAQRASGSVENAAAAVSASEQSLLARITYLQNRLQDGALTPAERRDLNQEARERENEARLLRLRHAEQEAAFAGPLDPIAEDAGSLLAALAPGELAVSYFLGGDASYVFAASVSGAVVRILPRRQEIEARVRRFLRLRASLQDSTPGSIPPGVLEQAGRELFAVLLEPVLAIADSAATLIIIPDGLLHHLPFPALADDRGMLLGRRACFVAPSLQTLGRLRQRAEARRRNVRPSIPIIAVGAEGGDRSGETAARLYPYDDRVMAYLPQAAIEARQVANLFAGALLLINDQATEQAFKESPLDKAAVVHIAAHGYADEREVRRSFLVLNPPPIARADLDRPGEELAAAAIEDGLLQWDEVAVLPLQCALVTLASCRSASGVLAAGEGVIGLTQAFLHAGASSVLATLGEVPDASARSFVLAFYERMRLGDTAVAALCAVQDMARYWPPADAKAAAEFVLVGDGNVRLPIGSRTDRARTVRYTLCLLAIAILAAAVFAFRRRTAAPR